MKNNYEIRGDATAILIERVDGTIIEAFVDTKELPRLMMFKCTWTLSEDKKTGSFYIQSYYRDSSNSRRNLYLHRFLTGAPEGLEVDHIDHNTLNNCLSNLRIISRTYHRQNLLTPPKSNTSGHIGVSWRKIEQKWKAQIQINKKDIWLGLYDTKEEAAKAVAEARAKFMPYSQEALMRGVGPVIGTK